MAADSTHAHTAEAERVTVDVRDHLVGDEGTARGLPAQQVSVWTCGVAEVVDGERLVLLIDEFYDLTDVLEGEHWHYGSKDLLSHELRVQVRL